MANSPGGLRKSPIFGKEHGIARSNPNFSTTSATFETALDIDMGIVPAGVYRVGWSFRSNNSKSNTDNQTQVAFNGLALVTNSVEGTANSLGGGLGEQFNGFADFTTLQQSMIITIDLRRTSGNGSARANTMNLEVWRIE